MGTSPNVRQKPQTEGKVFINRKFYDADFSGRDLTHSDFRGATLVNCNFDNADLAYANFESANCYKSTFRQSRCYHTNFKDAVLAETIMDPRDMFGLTLSVSCDTFDRMQLGSIWLCAWLFLPTLGEMSDGMREKVLGVLKDAMGEERLKAMERIFANRTI